MNYIGILVYSVYLTLSGAFAIRVLGLFRFLYVRKSKTKGTMKKETPKFSKTMRVIIPSLITHFES